MIRQSAISSASSSTRWIEAIVASMLTTTPFFSPREGCEPMPTTLSTPSGATSATMATIFDVPMSSPTIRFLLSFTIYSPLPMACQAAFFGGFSRNPGTRAANPFR